MDLHLFFKMSWGPKNQKQETWTDGRTSYGQLKNWVGGDISLWSENPVKGSWEPLLEGLKHLRQENATETEPELRTIIDPKKEKELRTSQFFGFIDRRNHWL